MSRFVGYVKRNPVLFGVTALIVALVIFVALRKGGDGGDQVVYTSAGPTDAQIAAQAGLAQTQLAIAGQVQLAGAQVAALAQQGQNDLALANIGAQVSIADLGAQERLGEKALASDYAALTAQLTAQSHMVDSNNQFQIDYARVAADSALESVRINAALQAQLSADQRKAYETAAVLSVIPTLKKKNRDDVLKLVGPSVINRG